MAVAISTMTRQWRRAGAGQGTRPALLSTAPLVAYLGAAYAVVYYLIPGRLSADLELYVARPLIWSGLGALAYLLWRRLADRPPLSRAFIALAVLAGMFQLSVMLLAGMLYGFGHSPYAHQLLNMAKNLLYIGTLLAGLEMSRAYLIHTWSRVSMVVAFAVVSLLYAGVMFAPTQYDFSGTGQAFRITGGTLLPAASESVAATFLASIGGPLPAFGYRFVLAAFEWFSPILPNLDWTVKAFLGTLTPVAAILLVRSAYGDEKSEEKEGEKSVSQGVSIWWILAGVVVVAFIWLNTGMLGVRPALISGMSMEPTFHTGDMVLTRDVPLQDLKVGDIVRYKLGGVAVVHRIVKIDQGDSGTVFTTKGDNNNTEDKPVQGQQIQGRVVLIIPKVGWASIYAERLLHRLRW